MEKKYAAAVIVVAMILTSGLLFAECGMCAGDSAKTEKAASTTAGLVKVNNTVCPVTGEPVNTKDPVTLEYKGKVYNFCCGMCPAVFKGDPEKYSKIAEDQAKGLNK